MVHGKVQAGRYNSASEVVREALRLMEERDQIKAMHKEELRNKIAAGLQSLAEGRGVDGEAVFARLEAALDEEIRVGDERADRQRNGRK